MRQYYFMKISDSDIDRTMRKCKHCGELLSIRAFVINGTGYYEYVCKDCKSKIAKEQYKFEKDNRTEKYWKKRYAALKRNAFLRGLKFHLTIDDLKDCYERQNKCCWYTGDPLIVDSIDRIDIERGYYPDNIIMCERYVNIFRGEISRDDFLTLCRKIANNHKYDGDDMK